MQTIKLIILGDGSVGKTCFLISYKTKSFPSEYVPTVFETELYEVVVNHRLYGTAYWDTAGGEDYDLLRPLTYPGTDIILLCFALDIEDSLENIRTRWIPELNRYIPNTPMVLVGCKSDLRETTPKQCISRDRIEAMAKDLNLDYYETSALAQIGLDECMEGAMMHAITGINTRNKQKLSRQLFKRKEKYAPTPLVLPTYDKAPVILTPASTFADDWQKMLNDSKFTDVLFLLEDGQQKLEAHKLVLCSASKFFRQILELQSNILNKLDDGDLTQEDLNSGRAEGFKAVYLTDNDKKIVTTIEINSNINAKTFTKVLEFLYTGSIQKMSELQNMSDAEIHELKRVAGIFKLPDLETVCTNIENKEEFYNSEIGTRISVEVGKEIYSLFFNQPSTTDVVFRVEDQNIYANKVVLSARCSVMGAMFGGNFLESNGTSLTEVKISNTTAGCFLALLEFLYTDHASIREINDWLGLLVLADEYGLSRLLAICELNLRDEVNRCVTKNKQKSEIDVINLLLTAQAYNADQLSQWCLHYISINYADFEIRPEFRQLKGSNKQFVEENRWPPLSYLEEEKRYNAERKEFEKRQCSVM